MGIEIELKGISELIDEVERMSVAPARVENAALKAGAQPICDEAKRSTAFVDHSGKLRDSITVGNVKSGQSGKYILVKTDDPVAHLVEEGHGGPAPAPAHPYMRPAFEAKKEEAAQIIADVLREAL